MNESNENEVEPGQGASKRPRLEPSFAVGAVLGGHVDVNEFNPHVHLPLGSGNGAAITYPPPPNASAFGVRSFENDGLLRTKYLPPILPPGIEVETNFLASLTDDEQNLVSAHVGMPFFHCIYFNCPIYISKLFKGHCSFYRIYTKRTY